MRRKQHDIFITGSKHILHPVGKQPNHTRCCLPKHVKSVLSFFIMPAASECCDKCCNQWLPQCRIARESDSLSPAIYFCVENLKRPISHRALWFEAKILMLLPYQLPSLIGDTFFSPRPTFQSPSSIKSLLAIGPGKHTAHLGPSSKVRDTERKRECTGLGC